MKTQQDTDDKLYKLVDTMLIVYSLVEDIEGLPEEIKIEVIKQTAEAAIFIQEYTGHGFSSTNLLDVRYNTYVQVSIRPGNARSFEQSRREDRRSLRGVPESQIFI
jgi:hypothetical protein